MQIESYSKQSSPPLLAEKFLSWSLPEVIKAPVLGDLAEEFCDLVISNPFKARTWYYRQAVFTGLQFMKKTQRGFIMFILSILVFLVFSTGGMLLGGGLSMYIDVPSALLVVPPAILFALGATSSQDMKNGFALLFNDSLTMEKGDLLTAKQFFTVMGNTGILMGIFSSIMGAVAMASHIGADEFSKVFGPALAVCILTLLYAFALKVLTYVAEQKIQNKINRL